MSGPLPAILSPLTTPASWCYGKAIQARNRRYDAGIGVHRAHQPVISVGNITTGGVGKTPMVMWIVDALLQRNVHPAILMRGYGPPTGGRSDEAMLYEDRFGDAVPVLINPDRVAAVTRAEHNKLPVDCFVMDDGFQHRALRRDLDLVLIDATRRTLDDRLLPAGHLREPTVNLRRADAVIITHAAEVDERLAGRVERLHGRPPVAWTDHLWSGLQVHSAGGVTTEPTTWLEGRRVVMTAGVGNPEGVRATATRHGAVVVAHHRVRDHDPFDAPTRSVLNLLSEGAEALLITGKDWVKLRETIDLTRWPCPIVTPELVLSFHAGESALLEAIETTLRIR